MLEISGVEVEADAPEPVVYFAYGSNMATARLRARTPSCVALGVATLPGHALRFHKASKDKSGKCNAFATDDGCSVISDKALERKVLTYLATPDVIDNDLKPYSWYKAYVQAGGSEHGLPADYIAQYIDGVETIEDPNTARDKKERATLD